MCGGLPCGCGAEVGRRIGGCLERTIGALPGGMLGVSLRVRHGGVAQRDESLRSRVSFDRRRHATRTHLQQAGTTGNTNSVSEEPNGTEQHPRRTHMVLETLAHGRRDRVDSTHASSRAGPPPSRGSLGTSACAGLVESARPAAADAPPRRARLPQLQRRTERHASIGCA